MTRVERIKEHLSRHDQWFKLNARTHENIEASVEQTLQDFLANKSLTGARIADLSSVNPVSGYRQGSPKYCRFFCGDEYSDAPTFDQAIAALWLKVFIDTEESND